MGKAKARPRCGWRLSSRDGFFPRWRREGPLAKEAFRLAAHKRSIPTITVERRGACMEVRMSRIECRRFGAKRVSLREDIGL